MTTDGYLEPQLIVEDACAVVFRSSDVNDEDKWGDTVLSALAMLPKKIDPQSMALHELSFLPSWFAIHCALTTMESRLLRQASEGCADSRLYWVASRQLFRMNAGWVRFIELMRSEFRPEANGTMGYIRVYTGRGTTFVFAELRRVDSHTVTLVWDGEETPFRRSDGAKCEGFLACCICPCDLAAINTNYPPKEETESQVIPMTTGRTRAKGIRKQ